MTKNRVIGRNNELPWHLPREMAHFRATTLGHPIIMGRRTFDSIQRKPLPRRQNIVLSRYELAEATVQHARNLDAALVLAEQASAKECFVIGGAEVYKEALPLADRLYETIIQVELEGDAWFPEFDRNGWQEDSVQHHPADSDNEFAFRITVLARRTRA